MDAAEQVSSSHREGAPAVGRRLGGTATRVPASAQRIVRARSCPAACRRDLPPEVRPVLEDNRMLREELRRYKHRLGEQEGQLAGHSRATAALQEELARERARLRQCAVSPEQLLQDREFREALQGRWARAWAKVGWCEPAAGCLLLFHGPTAPRRPAPPGPPAPLLPLAGTPPSGSCSSGAVCWRRRGTRPSGGWARS